MYRDCDHLIDENHIYTIRGNWDLRETLILVKPVYERKNNTERFVKIVDKKGLVGENLMWINPHEYDHINCKGINLKNYEGDTLWCKMVKAFINLGISVNDIGLFGSKRLGFKNCKDEDFIIYGRKNLDILHQNIEDYKRSVGLYNHTLAHAWYQADTHGKFFNKNNNDLLFCLLNKWSTCAFADKLTTTIRFVDDSLCTGEILKKYLYQRDFSHLSTFKGVVFGAIETSFMPRIFYLQTHSCTIKVITPLWFFHQCVKDNDLVQVTGTLIDDVLVLRSYDHGIRFI